MARPFIREISPRARVAAKHVRAAGGLGKVNPILPAATSAAVWKPFAARQHPKDENFANRARVDNWSARVACQRDYRDGQVGAVAQITFENRFSNAISPQNKFSEIGKNFRLPESKRDAG